MTIDNTDALRIVAKFVGAANSARDVCEFGELCDAFIEEARAVIAASPQAPAAQQAAEFERGRQLGMQQERALWELSASSQEIERAAQRLLGHKGERMTRHYVDGKYARKVKPAR